MTSVDLPLAFRTAGPDDTAALAALAERVFRDTFGPHNRPEDMDAYCRTAYAPYRSDLGRVRQWAGRKQVSFCSAASSPSWGSACRSRLRSWR